MLRYAITIFVSAFLLFQVQPLIGRFILPWFGGGPSIWTTCMLFFQLLLLAGYLYSHLISVGLSVRKQVLLHLGLLVGSLAFLPIEPSGAWKPDPDASPALHILLLLLATVGGPYFMLATTGPLLQRWFSRSFPGRSPYRLYSLSNAGSLLALLSYPFLFEPNLLLRQQTLGWTSAYVIYVLLTSWCAIRLLWNATTESTEAAEGSNVSPSDELSIEDQRPGWGRMLLWLGLSAGGSVMLLATTNQMCIDVATVPFLWILPLSLYLLTFIICFDNPHWYDRRVYGIFLLIGAPLACWILEEDADAAITDQVVVYSAILFGCCMACHGELVDSRPQPEYLTLFYVLVSAGGALGGLFVALIAPRIFNGYWEFHLGLLACCMATLIAWCMQRVWLRPQVLSFWIWVLVLILQLFLIGHFLYQPMANELLAVDHTVYFGVWLLLLFAGLAFTAAWQHRQRRLYILWSGLAILQLAWLTGYSSWKFHDWMPTERYIKIALITLLPIAGSYILLYLTRGLSELTATKCFRALLAFVVGPCLAALWYLEQLAAWQVAVIAGVSTFAVVLEWIAARFVSQSASAWGFRFWLPALSLLVLLGIRLNRIVMDGNDNEVHTSRNFYGVLKVRYSGLHAADAEPSDSYVLTHGQIKHGIQFVDEYWRRQPTTYYGPDSGIGLAIRLSRHRPGKDSSSPIRVGIIGLGTGTIAAYGQQGDVFRFYEINPDVEKLSDKIFTYLDESLAETEVIIGDARIVMERELAEGQSQQFDVLAVDAFSSDAIPVHLLTTECGEIYRRHLKADGILAVHISNRFLDLNPVARGLSQHLGWQAFRIEDDDVDATGVYSSTWILITSAEWLINDYELQEVADPSLSDESILPWTDDYSGLWRVLNF